MLAEHGYEVVGVDLSPRMVDQARLKAHEAGVSVQFDVGNAAEPRLEPSALDVVFGRHVVWAMPDPAKVLRRWVTLLRLGGRLVLVEGCWGTGAGLSADSLTSVVAPLMGQIDVTPLPDPTLWGKRIEDERYGLVARQPK